MRRQEAPRSGRWWAWIIAAQLAAGAAAGPAIAAERIVLGEEFSATW